MLATDTLDIAKSDDHGGNSSPAAVGSVVAGTSLTYTIVATNNGADTVTGAKIADTFPSPDFIETGFTATATGSPTGFTDSGTGDIDDTVTMPAGSSITYTVSGTVSATAASPLSNTATITPPAGDTNNGTGSATDSDTVTVAAGPLAPVGTISISATEGTTFTGTAVATFSDTDTSLPAGDFTATINWGDGASSTGTSVTVTGGNGTFTVSGNHLYADEITAGSASVVLTQTTGGTATATATGTATVAEADTLTAGSTPVSATATAGNTFTGTVATFTTTYTGNSASDFTATINWGDGTSSTVVPTGSNGTLTVAGSHVYATAGAQTASVLLKDDAPGTATATATATITVASPPNVVSPVGSVSISATVGTTFSSSALATFTETDATVPAGDFTATINWGDGSSSTGTVSGSGGTFTVAGSHLYSTTLSAAAASVVLTENAPATASATATGTATVIAAPATPTSGYLAGQAGDGTNQTFLTNLYRELLGRDPDSTGQTAWMNVLGTTPASDSVRAAVISGFLNSTEYRAHFVTVAYETLLGRAPEPGGLQYFEGVLAGYQDFTLVIEWIAASPEYFSHNGGTNESFVTALYRDLLGRAEDPGAAGWVNILNAGQLPRGQVVRDILFSQEGLQKLFNGNFAFQNGGTPNSSAGSAQTGSYALATLTGNGISNLYFQGNLNQSAINDAVNYLYVVGNNQINGNQVNTTQMLINYLSTPQYFG